MEFSLFLCAYLTKTEVSLQEAEILITHDIV